MAVLQLGYGTDADEVIKFNCSISRKIYFLRHRNWWAVWFTHYHMLSYLLYTFYLYIEVLLYIYHVEVFTGPSLAPDCTAGWELRLAATAQCHESFVLYITIPGKKSKFAACLLLNLYCLCSVVKLETVSWVIVSAGQSVGYPQSPSNHITVSKSQVVGVSHSGMPQDTKRGGRDLIVIPKAVCKV